MADGNRIFEVLGKKYFTLYEDKRDMDHRIRKDKDRRFGTPGPDQSSAEPGQKSFG
jgi:hypothetical protein